MADVEKDRLHPTKRHRPIARGSISVPAALVLGILILAGSLLAAFRLSVPFGLVATAYAVLLTAYFGGAIATQVRVGADWFPVVFPALLGGLLWSGLSFSDGRVRRLLTIARTA